MDFFGSQIEQIKQIAKDTFLVHELNEWKGKNEGLLPHTRMCAKCTMI